MGTAMMRPTIPIVTLMEVTVVDLAWTKNFVLIVSVTLEIYVSISIRASVMMVGSDTIGDPIFQKGLQN